MIPELVKTYLKDNKLSYRGMAAEISNQLGVPEAISYNTIYLWIKGSHTPRPTLFQLLSKQGTGALRELAQEILKELENGQPVQG